MTHDDAVSLIMSQMTIAMLREFKPDDVDLLVWLSWAADLAIDVYNEKHKAA
jgi:hypothetical protein